MTVILNSSTDQIPETQLDLFNQWMSTHPNFLEFHLKWQQWQRQNRPTEELEIHPAMYQILQELGFTEFSLRGNQLWITLHDYDIYTTLQ